MKKSLTMLTTVAMLAISGAAYADHHGGGKGAEWQGLSDAEKLERIEKRRMEHRKKLDAKWNAMSDDEKLKHVEGKMGKRKENRQERRHERREDRQSEE